MWRPHTAVRTADKSWERRSSRELELAVVVPALESDFALLDVFEPPCGLVLRGTLCRDGEK